MARPLSLWRLTQMLWQALCQAIGLLHLSDFRKLSEQERRGYCDTPRKRPKQSARAVKKQWQPLPLPP
jgi:hypothetical protein